MERLQKVMAHAGVASRRKCEQLILDGKVKVNGTVVRELGIQVDPRKDLIEVNGKQIQLEQKSYILLYKPVGVITSVRDPRGRKTVIDLIGSVQERVYPVGRLDYDTSGLLLLTNDGELAYRITHPRYELDKVYQVTVKGIPHIKTIERLKNGVELEDGVTAPAKVRILSKDVQKGQALLEMTIHEGRNRQIRRMCKAVGHPVKKLKRVQIAFLTLDGLKPGEYRHLEKKEVTELKKMVGSGSVTQSSKNPNDN
ncbi:MAG: rRNA pseudouridine synthase [Bacillaceae bacterium]|nr:rRNA pseudouridine synthase [Bacillaceae bacterium]